ncbi:MAG: EamA family transporter [Candidatus Zixiibacteriota bacterium]|nr:MAG: EamA family transporter [candidate division Zixibacteria bacterium]
MKIILGFAAIYVIWGSTYLAIRFGVETIPPFLMAGVRFIIGGGLLYGFVRARGVPAPQRSHWKPALIMGLLMPAGGTGLVTWAETLVPSGLTALLVATAPMWIVLADWLRPKGTRPTVMVVAGLFLGLAGMSLLINPTDIGGFNEVNKLGAVVIIIAALSWSVGSVYSRYAHQPRSKLLGVAMQMIAGGGGLVLVSLLVGELGSFEHTAVSLKSLLALGYLISLGSLAFVAYIWLLAESTPARAATYAYVNPIIALVLGAVLAGETLSVWTLGCSAIVITSVIMIITARTRAGETEITRASPRPVQPVSVKEGEICHDKSS